MKLADFRIFQKPPIWKANISQKSQNRLISLSARIATNDFFDNPPFERLDIDQKNVFSNFLWFFDQKSKSLRILNYGLLQIGQIWPRPYQGLDPKFWVRVISGVPRCCFFKKVTQNVFFPNKKSIVCSIFEKKIFMQNMRFLAQNTPSK